MPRFFSCLTYSKTELFTAADIVQHSFIVQNSVSYLNLELTQSYGVEISCHTFYELHFSEKNDRPSFSYSKDMINTEEKCRKIHGDREFLYRYHLDMPKAREKTLRNVLYVGKFYPTPMKSSIPIVQLYIDRDFYVDKLFEFVEYAFKHNYDKLKILKWLIKFHAIYPRKFYMMPHWILTCFAYYMRFEFTDIEFVTECLRKLDFEKWVLYKKEPGRLRYILCQVHRTGRKPEIMEWCNRLISKYLLDNTFQNLRDIMKFQNAPKFTDSFKNDLVSSLCKKFSGACLYYWNDLLSTEPVAKRYTMVLHLLWFYVNREGKVAAASEALRLLWISVPDIFLTMEELRTVYKVLMISSDGMESIYDFYCQAVGKFDTSVEPRSLKHICRSIIRKALGENNLWLPNGIKQTGLPANLQSYLNLEI